MKATRGTLSNEGIVPYSKAQDVPGVFARNLEDLRIMLSVMAGKDFARCGEVTIGFLEDEDLDDRNQTPEALQDAYDDLRFEFGVGFGSSPRIPRVPHELYAQLFQLLDTELERDLSNYLGARSGSSWSSLGSGVAEGMNLEFDEVTGELLSLPLDGFERAHYPGAIDIAATRMKIEREFIQILEPLFEAKEVIVAPAYSPAEKLDLKRGYRTRARTYMSYLDGLSSVVGWPSLTLPFTYVAGLPAGLVMVAKPGGEPKLLAAAQSVSRNFQKPTWRGLQRG